MKKNGFTLSEIIIALGVIGVVAAITTPILSGLMPDKDKVAVLKTYKIINDVNEEILNTKSWLINNNINNGCVDLACIEAPQFEIGNAANNAERNMFRNHPYEALFSRNLETIDTPVYNPANRVVTFQTSDGHTWNIRNLNNGRYAIGVYINPDKQQCTYSNNCQKPGEFSFVVNEQGKTSGNDPLTVAYLANPTNLNDKNADFSTASNDKNEYSSVRFIPQAFDGKLNPVNPNLGNQQANNNVQYVQP